MMWNKMTALLAEFVGTFMLVFTVGCNILGKTSALFAATSIACTLMVMIYSFASVSGGHLNPAVTLAAVLARKFTPSLGVSYILVQIAAGISASFAYCSLFHSEIVLAPKAGFSWVEAMLVEVLYTAMLAFVVLSVTSIRNNPEDNPNQFYALAIGFVVVAGGYAAGPVSGGCFNPAVSIGMDLSSYSDGFYQGAAYCCYQVIGAGLATLLFRLTRPEDYAPPEEVYQYEPVLATKLASEFVGTFMLVLTVGLNVLGESKAVAWSAAAALMCMIYSLGDVSGAHFNPAVTVAVVLSRKGNCSVCTGLAYMIMQCIAGLLASLLFAGIYDARTFPLGPQINSQTGLPYPESAAYVMEFLFTFVLCFVVLSTACVKGINTKLDRNYYFAFAIGSCVTAGGFASGAVSGGCLNPAVSFGVGVSHTLNEGSLYYLPTFCMFELLAGVAAALIFHVTHAKEYSKAEQQKPTSASLMAGRG